MRGLLGLFCFSLESFEQGFTNDLSRLGDTGIGDLVKHDLTVLAAPNHVLGTQEGQVLTDV